jgi:hypothetical protein
MTESKEFLIDNKWCQEGDLSPLPSAWDSFSYASLEALILKVICFLNHLIDIFSMTHFYNIDNKNIIFNTV